MDGVLGFLNDPMVLGFVGIIWGLFIKYHPKFSNWPNAAIPYLNTVLALIVKLAAPTEAHAGELAIIGTVLPPALGFLGAAASAAWQAALNSLFYEVFLRHPAGAVLNKNS